MPNGKKNEFEGEAKDLGGRAERQAGEWTGDKQAQVRGAAAQAEGKGQKALGKLKDQAERLQGAIKKKPKKAA